MNYKYAPLYKRTTTGATQTWWIEQEGDRYRMHSGQLGGAITVSAWTTAKPKNVGRANETTGEQQASAEVDSAYELKRKKGYLDTPDEAQASDRFQCMLAEHFNQKPKEADATYRKRMAKVFAEDGRVVAPGNAVYLQPKLDGIRCIANAKGLWSRTNARIVSVPHIFEALRPIFVKYPGILLDGELYNHDFKYNFNQISSLVTKTKPEPGDLLETAALVQYWVYDSISGYREAPFSARFDIDRFEGLIEHPLVWVPTFEAHHRLEIDGLYESFLAEGYEGAMVRLDVPYENKRTYSLLKRKEKMDAEFKIKSFEEGDGNAAGMAKIAHMHIVINGKPDTFKADICGTREECREYLARRMEFVGKEATIEFQNYTPDGKPRFPKLKVAHLKERW